MGDVHTLPWWPASGCEPYFVSPRAVIFHGDCIDVLDSFSDGAFDHVITDPPYSDHVHTNTRTNKGTDGGSGGAEHDLGFDSLSVDLRGMVAHEIRRLVKRWALVFSDLESTHLWREDLCADFPDGDWFEYVRTGIWLKGGAMPQITGDRPGSGFESITITHAPRESGRLRWNGGGKVNVWRERVPQKRDGRVHPSEKPWPLLVQLLRDFTDEGDVILDPFAGSGSLARAALDVPGRRVVLIEADEQWCAQAASRLGGPVPDDATGQRGLQW